MRAVVTRTIAAVGALVVLAAVNGSIIAKERIKTHGQRIFLERVGACMVRLARAACPARVEQDELELVAQAGQVAEVQGREAGASTVANQDCPLAGAPVGETPPVACL